MQGKEELIHGLHATKNSTNHWGKTENKKSTNSEKERWS